MSEALQGYITAAKSILYFVGGYAIALIALYIIPPLTTAMLNTVGLLDSTGGASQGTLISFLLILVWAIVLLVIPAMKLVEGLRAITPQTKSAIIGVLWFIFTGAFFYFGYYLLGAFASTLTDSTLLMLMFYFGFFIQAIAHLVIIPYISIVKGSSQ